MGLSYVDYKGNEHPARVIREPCRGCFYKCSEKFDENQRTYLHQHYWGLSTEQKHVFVQTNIDRITKKRCYVKHESRRTFSFVYHFPLNDKREQVCATFFTNTLNISKKRIYISLKKELTVAK